MKPIMRHKMTEDQDLAKEFTKDLERGVRNIYHDFYRYFQDNKPELGSGNPDGRRKRNSMSTSKIVKKFFTCLIMCGEVGSNEDV